ncbi:hypothetical protein PMAYCL1PPCAC_20701, partial [Pristionchus mayeri]
EERRWAKVRIDELTSKVAEYEQLLQQSHQDSDAKAINDDDTSKRMKELGQRLIDVASELDEERKWAKERIDELTSKVCEYELLLQQSCQDSDAKTINDDDNSKKMKELEQKLIICACILQLLCGFTCRIDELTSKIAEYEIQLQQPRQ